MWVRGGGEGGILRLAARGYWKEARRREEIVEDDLGRREEGRGGGGGGRVRPQDQPSLRRRDSATPVELLLEQSHFPNQLAAERITDIRSGALLIRIEVLLNRQEYSSALQYIAEIEENFIGQISREFFFLLDLYHRLSNNQFCNIPY